MARARAGGAGGRLASAPQFEHGELPDLDLSNPYLLAYLRGGKPPSVQLVVVSLIDRGLILTERGMVAVRDDQVVLSVRSPLERAALIRLRQIQPTSVEALLHDPFLDASCEGLAEELRGRGLLAAPRLKGHRALVFLFSALVLSGVALLKVAIALSRGRHNVLFLVASAAIACILALRWANPRLTVLGERVLSDMRELFTGLHARAETIAAGGGTAELALLVGVFGIGALPHSVFPHKQELFRPPLRPIPRAHSVRVGRAGSAGRAVVAGRAVAGRAAVLLVAHRVAAEEGGRMRQLSVRDARDRVGLSWRSELAAAFGGTSKPSTWWR